MTAWTTWRAIRERIAARWLLDGEGEFVGLSLDAIKDAFAERLELGMLASMPQNGPNGETAPTDALDAMGRDRRVVRGIDETDGAYAARLLLWLDDRRYAGAAFSMMRQLAGYVNDTTASFRIVDNRGNWYSRSAAGVETYLLNTGNWNWDGDTAKWSRFWVIVYPGSRWTVDAADAWGSGTWGSAEGWGADVTTGQAAILRSLVRDWKPDGTRCEAIILAFDAASFDPSAPEPDGTWGTWATGAGVWVPSRLSTARYIDGV